MNKPFHLQINLHRLNGSVEELHIHTDYDHELHAPLIAATKARKEVKSFSHRDPSTDGGVSHGQTYGQHTGRRGGDPQRTR